jgi:putative Holliday junction resolvase
MRSLGLDIGDKRTGVAVSDAQGILASPLTVIASEGESALIEEILRLAEEYEADCVVIGLPRRLDGRLGEQANKVTALADELSRQAKQSSPNQFNIQLWDERLSTKAAQRLKVESSKKDRARSRTKRKSGYRSFAAKSEVDAIAAALILQGFLDSCHPDQ